MGKRIFFAGIIAIIGFSVAACASVGKNDELKLSDFLGTWKDSDGSAFTITETEFTWKFGIRSTSYSFTIDSVTPAVNTRDNHKDNYPTGLTFSGTVTALNRATWVTVGSAYSITLFMHKDKQSINEDALNLQPYSRLTN